MAGGAGRAEPAGPVLPDHAVIGAARSARFVLLGEATHGTSEFHSERAAITARLIEDARPSAVVIEADVPEVERLNLYVRGSGEDHTAAAALSGFRRFPRWMWRNAEFAAFVDALRAANLRLPAASRVGLYGMDVYDLYGALDRVRAHAGGHRAVATALADAMKCFAPHRRSTEAYGIAARKPARSCAAPAEALLHAVQQTFPAGQDGDGEARFAAIQAAAAVIAGEAYFRASYAGAYSWNVRERSMAATVRRVAAHAEGSRAGSARVVVWTHNSHVAHAASTAMANRGEQSMADLLRQDGAAQVFAIGFLTRSGTFMAAPAWDRPGRIYRLTPAARDSVEGLLRRSGEGRAMVMLRGAAPTPPFSEWRPQRGIGAVFDAQDPKAVYSRVRLGTEFDAVGFLNETQAVHPLA